MSKKIKHSIHDYYNNYDYIDNFDHDLEAQETWDYLFKEEEKLKEKNKKIIESMVLSLLILSRKKRLIKPTIIHFMGLCLLNISSIILSKVKNFTYYQKIFYKHFKQFESNLYDILENETDKNKIKDEVKKIQKILENNINRIIVTELWREVNTERLNIIIKKGYKYKTTKHIFDKVTGKDSIYYAGLKQVMPVDKPFHYFWLGVERVFMVGPDRPHTTAR